MSSLLSVLINSAEKAANIARLCRSNEDLLALLIQEKVGTEANPRFEHDFKTLADVLIQESIKHDVGNLFPELRNAILGEETQHFTNKLGENIVISVGETEAETAKCLEQILNGNKSAAQALAAEVHYEVVYESAQLGVLPELPELDYTDLGIWIDPIDATAEYISGDSIFTNFPGITSSGLDCVTVLIGAYELSSGVPVLGIVAQPFGTKSIDNVYSSLVYWGVSLTDLRVNNCQFEVHDKNRLFGIFSSSEKSEILQHFSGLGYKLVFSAGAGYKALKLITHEVDVYILSFSTTFKWDTCAPQAILRSLGGDIFDFRASVQQQKPISIKYRVDRTKDWTCNQGGLIAVRNLSLVEPLLSKLSA